MSSADTSGGAREGLLPPSVPLLALDRVERVYAGPPEVRALQHVSLEIREGEYVAIVGPSGSGKSTLLNILGLLDRPTCGEYLLGGASTTRMAERRLASTRARHIGFVFQRFQLLGDRTAIENVELGLLYHGCTRRVRRDAAEIALARVGLERKARASSRTLSGGEAQRVAIARAIATRPAVLLCDEPTGNLDRGNTQMVVDLLASLNETGLTVVVVTHDPHVASNATRTIEVLDGVAKDA